MLTVEQLAEELNVTTRTIRNYLKEGKLTGTKVGGQWRFTEQNIYDFFGKTDDLNEENNLALNYLKQVPELNQGLTVLTFQFDSDQAISLFRDKTLAHFNLMYAESSVTKKLNYQLLPQKFIRITLTGPNYYLIDFSPWITHHFELLNLK